MEAGDIKEDRSVIDGFDYKPAISSRQGLLTILKVVSKLNARIPYIEYEYRRIAFCLVQQKGHRQLQYPLHINININ